MRDTQPAFLLIFWSRALPYIQDVFIFFSLDMKFFKMYVSLLLSVCVLGSIAFAGRVSYQIVDTDTRFQPVDAFHKGCEQTALLRLGIKEK